EHERPVRRAPLRARPLRPEPVLQQPGRLPGQRARPVAAGGAAARGHHPRRGPDRRAPGRERAAVAPAVGQGHRQRPARLGRLRARLAGVGEDAVAVSEWTRLKSKIQNPKSEGNPNTEIPNLEKTDLKASLLVFLL